MTTPVELERLVEVAGGFGTVPLLLTVDPDGRPRAAAVTVSWDGVHAMVGAGRKSLRNAGERPLVGLLWPAPPGDRFALLVDGEAVTTEPGDDESGSGTVIVRATSGILHAVLPGKKSRHR
jgi:hypothetical protein